MLNSKKILVVAAALALVTGCSKKKEEDDSETVAATPASTGTTSTTSETGTASEAAKPGKVVGALDEAMSSVAFEGQAAALRLTAWEDEHCKSEGSGVVTAYENDEVVKWGCKLRVATNGPDTPRGAVARVKALACSLDRALESGDLAIDGALHTVTFTIDDVCWGTSFATMVKESSNFADKIR